MICEYMILGTTIMFTVTSLPASWRDGEGGTVTFSSSHMVVKQKILLPPVTVIILF